MTSLFETDFLINLGLVAVLLFVVFTGVMLAYLVLESQGSLTTLLWRALILVIIIPCGVIFLTIPLITPLLLSEMSLGSEELQLIALGYLLSIASLSVIFQALYIRHLVIDEMLERKMSFLEYFKYLLRTGRVRQEEAEKLLDDRFRTDTLLEKIDQVRPEVFGERTTSITEVTMNGVIADKGGDYFGVRWKQTLVISGAEVGFIFLLLWAALFSLFFLPMGGAVFIALLGVMIYLFLTGVLLDIRMNETPFLIGIAPMVSLILFVYSTHFLAGFQSLRDTTLTAIFAVTIFYASIFPVFLFFSVYIGAAIRDWLLTGTTVRRSLTRSRTLILAAICTLGIFLIFQLNNWVFSLEQDQFYVVIESMLFVSIVLALTGIPLDEKLLVSIAAPVLAFVISLIAGVAINLFSTILLLIGSLFFSYFIDILDLNPKRIRPQLVIIVMFSLSLLSVVWYLIPYNFVSNQAFVIVLLGIACTTILFTIKLNLEPEEGLVFGLVVTIAFIALIMTPDLVPRYEQLDDLMMSNLITPFFILIVGSVVVGQKIRRNLLCIANDGHKLANKGERYVDDWLLKHGLDHDVHPVVGDSLRLSFLVKQRDQEYYIQFWQKFQGSEDMVRYHSFQQLIEENQIKVEFIHPNDLDYLDSRLEYILKGTDPYFEGVRLSY